MKIRKKSLAAWALAIVILFIAYYAYSAFFTPTYEDIYTPKPVYGHGNILIEEFADLECPACRIAHFHMQEIKEKYKDKIAFKYYHYPLAYHRFAQKGAEAIECANDQGMFFEFVDIAYRNPEKLSTSYLKRYAAVLGMNTDLFRNCLDSGAKEQVVLDDYAEGLRRNVQYTPSFFVNGKLVQDWRTIEQTILELD